MPIRGSFKKCLKYALFAERALYSEYARPRVKKTHARNVSQPNPVISALGILDERATAISGATEASERLVLHGADDIAIVVCELLVR